MAEAIISRRGYNGSGGGGSNGGGGGNGGDGTAMDGGGGGSYGDGVNATSMAVAGFEGGGAAGVSVGSGICII